MHKPRWTLFRFPRVRCILTGFVLTAAATILGGPATAGEVILGLSNSMVNSSFDALGVAGHFEIQFLDIDAAVSPIAGVSVSLPDDSRATYTILWVGAKRAVRSQQNAYLVFSGALGLGNRWGASGGRFGLDDEAFLAVIGKVGAHVPVWKRLSWSPAFGVTALRHNGAAGASEGHVGVFADVISVSIRYGD
ncbi:MAG: hypothetical protein KC729_04615 [Candidatus Eisenbacteria bacterium]|uniref:Uncharacterized protein n=1 Tax=Eiseniibacteriota bacterium TaxID=2212470 RepID=A0A956RNC2_UNCEI|nr:hypothetical protein [Candidatus Eisenbacteria bacterium]